MSKKLFFEVESHEVTQDDENSHFATARILAFSSGLNRHDYVCKEETLRETAHTLDYKPIVYMIDHLFQDFGTHAKEADKSLISGFIIPGSQEFERLEDGRLGLFVSAKIWKKYANAFMRFMERDDGEKSVSVEMDLYEASQDMENPNIQEMRDFEYNGVCVLGDSVQEASPGANLKMLSFAKEQDEYNKIFVLEFGKYEELDFTIPQKVKENAKRGLELRKEYGRGSTSVGVATARYLISNKTASPEKVRHIAKYFPRHEGDNLDDKTSNGWISWLVWGGNAGRSWSTKLVRQMDKKDNENMSFFAEDEISKKEEKTEMIKDKEEPQEEEMAAEETPEETSEENMATEEQPSEEPEEEQMSEDEGGDEETEEPESEDMSLDAYADVPAMLALLESETDENRELARSYAEEKSVNWEVMAKALYAKASRIKEESGEKEKAYMSENDKLKEFKLGVEKEQFDFAVGKIINEVEKVLPKDKLEEVKEDAKNFSLETIDGFKNKTLALAFEYAKDKKNDKDEKDFVVYGFPVSNAVKTDSPWG